METKEIREELEKIVTVNEKKMHKIIDALIGDLEHNGFEGSTELTLDIRLVSNEEYAAIKRSIKLNF